MSPWKTSVPRMTANVMKMMRLRAGKRVPVREDERERQGRRERHDAAHPGPAHDDDRLPGRIRVGRAVLREQEARQVRAREHPERGARRPSSRTSRRCRPRRPATARSSVFRTIGSWRPMRTKTSAFRRKITVCQTAVLSIRVFEEQDPRARTAPARRPPSRSRGRPETCRCSATMYVTNETRSEAVVARIVSSR